MTPGSRSSKVTMCPSWCVGHRVDDSGRSYHVSAMQYAGGLYIGLQQSRRGGTGPAVALLRTLSDDNPVVELDEYDATELAEALLETAADLEAATAV